MRHATASARTASSRVNGCSGGTAPGRSGRIPSCPDAANTALFPLPPIAATSALLRGRMAGVRPPTATPLSQGAGTSPDVRHTDGYARSVSESQPRAPCCASMGVARAAFCGLMVAMQALGAGAAEGPAPQQENAGSGGLPVWSSDGQWIAFRSNRGGSWAIYAVHPTFPQSNQALAGAGGWRLKGLVSRRAP
jgi:hypothetical protein